MKKILFLLALTHSLFASAKIRTDIFKPNTPYTYENPGQDFNKKHSLSVGDTVLLPKGYYDWISIYQATGITFLGEDGAIVGEMNFGEMSSDIVIVNILFNNHSTNHKHLVQIHASGIVKVINCHFLNGQVGIHVAKTPTEKTAKKTVDLLIEGCNFRGSGQEAIYVGHDLLGGPFINGVIRNNVLRNITNDGIQIRNGSFLVEGNDLDSIGMGGSEGHAHGIPIGGNTKGAIVRNNKLRNVGYYGIFCNGYGDFLFENNDVESKSSAIIVNNGYSKTQDLQKVGYQKFTVKNNRLKAANSYSLEAYYSKAFCPQTIYWSNNTEINCKYFLRSGGDTPEFLVDTTPPPPPPVDNSNPVIAKYLVEVYKDGTIKTTKQ